MLIPLGRRGVMNSAVLNPHFRHSHNVGAQLFKFLSSALTTDWLKIFFPSRKTALQIPFLYFLFLCNLIFFFLSFAEFSNHQPKQCNQSRNFPLITINSNEILFKIQSSGLWPYSQQTMGICQLASRRKASVDSPWFTYTSAEYVGTLRKPTFTEHSVNFTINLESIPAA